MKKLLIIIFAVAILLPCSLCAERSQDSGNAFLNITGIPKIFVNNQDRWGLIIIDQLYDSLTQSPVELDVSKVKEGVSITLMYSNKMRNTGKNTLSYNLMIYRVDFLGARSLVCKMSDFKGLPADFTPSGMNSSDVNRDSPILTMMEISEIK